MITVLSSSLVLSTLLTAPVLAMAKTPVKTQQPLQVNYSCQQGKSLTVTYGFNQQGLPTYASAAMGGKTRYMPLNLNRSDRNDTIFGDENNYSLSSSYMDQKNFNQQPVMVTDPGQQIVYKDCNPTGQQRPQQMNATPAQPSGTQATNRRVTYKCQQAKTITVAYAFNRQGLPTHASAFIAGKSRYMPINLNRSDRVDTVFGDENNYSLSSAYMDSKNFNKQPIMITDPGQQIVYKNCTPAR